MPSLHSDDRKTASSLGVPAFERWRYRTIALTFGAFFALLGFACGTDPVGTSSSAAGSSSAGGAGGTAVVGVAGGAGAGQASVAGTASLGGSGAGGSTGSGGSSGGAASAGNGSVGGAGSGGAASGGGAAGAASAGAASSGGTSAGGAGGGGAGGAPAVGRSAGCSKTSTVTFGQVPGETDQAKGFGTGGYVKIGNRGFALRLPDNYDNTKPYWLIFGFHWNGGNSKEVDTGGSNGYNMSHFGLQKLSQNGAIFVAPDGLNAGWANSGGQDLKFVDDMVKLIEDNYCVDTSHIFANGFSYGGGMSYAIACARAKVFRGVAIYDGAVLSGCEGGNDPIAYWQMAGLTDNVCTVAAGRGMRDKFVQANGCAAQSPPEPPQPPPYLSNGGHVCTNYSGCSSGHPLRWCVHQSGHGNAIVDGTADLYNTCATPPKTCSTSCPCTWVPDDVWAFFKSL